MPVAAPAETTWAALTDWTRQGEWMLGTSVRVTGGDGRGVGSTLAAFTGVGPLGFTDTMRITGLERRQRSPDAPGAHAGRPRAALASPWPTAPPSGRSEAFDPMGGLRRPGP